MDVILKIEGGWNIHNSELAFMTIEHELRQMIKKKKETRKKNGREKKMKKFNENENICGGDTGMTSTLRIFYLH